MPAKLTPWLMTEGVEMGGGKTSTMLRAAMTPLDGDIQEGSTVYGGRKALPHYTNIVAARQVSGGSEQNTHWPPGHQRDSTTAPALPAPHPTVLMVSTTHCALRLNQATPPPLHTVGRMFVHFVGAYPAPRTFPFKHPAAAFNLTA